jgi:uncharacterized protein YjeT (DUF2065 family)
VSSRLETIVSIVGLRSGLVGLSLILAPRWLRRMMTDFMKLSDNEMRVIGYVLVGTAASILAQQATKQTLAAKLEALSKERPALAS